MAERKAVCCLGQTPICNEEPGLLANRKRSLLDLGFYTHLLLLLSSLSITPHFTRPPLRIA